MLYYVYEQCIDINSVCGSHEYAEETDNIVGVLLLLLCSESPTKLATIPSFTSAKKLKTITENPFTLTFVSSFSLLSCARYVGEKVN